VLSAALLRVAGGCLDSGGPGLDKHWPGFRGPDGQGVLATGSAPVTWNESTSQGIVWKSRVPLSGASSPVVCGDLVFLTGADAASRKVYCFDAGTGVLVWQRSVSTGSPVQEHGFDDSTFAGPSVAMDGKRVYAVFGNGDLACFDYEGNQVWAVGLGLPENGYGHCSSPVLCDDLLIVELDQNREWDMVAGGWAYHSEVLAVNTGTGGVVWEKSGTDRLVQSAWTTPIVIDVGGSKQIVTCATSNAASPPDPNVVSFDPATGNTIWSVAYPGSDLTASLSFVDGVVVIAGGYVAAAYQPNGTGDVTTSHLAWTYSGAMPDVPSPVGANGLVYLLQGLGTVTCLNAGDGTERWTQNIGTSGTSFYASLAVVGDQVYAVRRDGVTTVFKDNGGAYQELGTGSLQDTDFAASPAFAHGRIYLRGKEYLYCLGN
jgi:outer membrane protein assembly factor BamB